MAVAGILNIPKLPLFSSLPLRKRLRSLSISIKASNSQTSTKEEENPSFSSSSSSSSTTRTATTFAPPPNFKPPEPKPFAIRPDKTWDVVGASLALFFRLGTGVFVSGLEGERDIEDRPSSGEAYRDIRVRRVREIVAVLDIDVLFYPCPKNGPNFRPKVAQMGGKQQFPYMVDPNTGVAMYESDDIIKYLVEKYGDGSVPFMLSLGLLTTLTAGFAMIGRMGRGNSYTPSKLPPKPLEIWSYEGSPFCKIIREVLVELELPHIQRSCARGSPKRQILYEKAGHFQVPYLEDPNTGVQMFESAEIVEYLRATYAQ
ncbi:Glutathione S-transferase 2 [Gossypium arboreum]|uniref:Glutathione S-transferase 2 n=1 Tax=Gossypium arboreum TaxID=29729 RepID=A0A0B0MVY1_GOSAR|nr:Glutathione S-transferase 2 [Gossypium arboreum]